MKRPEGFDRNARNAQPEPARPPRARQPKKPESSKPEPRQPKRPQSKLRAERTATSAPSKQPRAAAPATAAAKRELKQAAKERRRYERSEVKRFTQRSRRRRLGWLVAFLSMVVVGGLVAGAVYSPLLSLRKITVTGTALVDQKQVLAAVDDQIGTPLALVNFGEIGRRLAKFPLIRSYVTESVPPDTLIIRISERSPIGSLATPAGFSVVDAAGVVIESGAARKPGLPLIDIGTANKKSPAFTSAVGVLLALPKDLLSKVERISAQTMDDVTLTLTGVGQKVTWGSPENSALKARVLAALITKYDAGRAITYDVSAPNTPVVSGT